MFIFNEEMWSVPKHFSNPYCVGKKIENKKNRVIAEIIDINNNEVKLLTDIYGRSEDSIIIISYEELLNEWEKSDALLFDDYPSLQDGLESGCYSYFNWSKNSKRNIYQKKEQLYIGEYKKIDFNLLTQNEVIVLYAFSLAMHDFNLDDSYSYSNFSEKKLCVYNDNNNWKVYKCLNGLCKDIVECESCLEALLHSISTISRNVEEEKYLLYRFTMYLHNNFSLKELDGFVSSNIDIKPKLK